jgi:hypothetical protein
MRFSDLKKVFLNAYADYATFAKGKKFYQYTTAITPGTTATTTTAGSLAITTHATGRNQIFVSDGALWQNTRGSQVYAAIVAQAGTAAPTATVLENTLGGTVVLARSSAGVYTFTLTGVFTTAKTVILASVDSGATAVMVRVAHTSANVVTITTANASAVAADLVGNLNLLITVHP